MNITDGSGSTIIESMMEFGILGQSLGLGVAWALALPCVRFSHDRLP